MTNVIYFYSKDEPFYEFSNYYPCNINMNWAFLSVEHYYQTCKFYDENNPRSIEYMYLLYFCDSPQKTKDMGNQRCSRFGSRWLINKKKPELGLMNDRINEYLDVKIRSDWESVKEYFMMQGLIFKFSQNLNLRHLLLSTGDAYIVENSKKDYYWGIGDGTGKNRLGVLLMKVRDLLKSGTI